MADDGRLRSSGTRSRRAQKHPIIIAIFKTTQDSKSLSPYIFLLRDVQNWWSLVDATTWALGSVALLYGVAFVLTIWAAWSSVLKWRGVDGRRLGIILNSGAILAATIASIMWIALDPLAPQLLKEHWFAWTIFLIGIVALIVALRIPNADATPCISATPDPHARRRRGRNRRGGQKRRQGAR